MCRKCQVSVVGVMYKIVASRKVTAEFSAGSRYHRDACIHHMADFVAVYFVYRVFFLLYWVFAEFQA